MALDGLMLHTIAKRLQILVGGRIGKIQNISEEEIAFFVHTRENGSVKLVINLHSNTNRVYLTKANISALAQPGTFVMVLRKYLSQAFITSVEQAGFDRILKIGLQARSELGDIVHYDLYAEIMGKYANLLLVNDQDIIVDALKRIPVFENSKRLIHPGARYVLPDQPDKRPPDQPGVLDMDQTLVSQLQGFSPLISKEFLFRMQQGEDYASILNAVFDSDTLYMYGGKNFHVIPLLHLNKEAKTAPLMDGLHHLYEGQEEKARIRELAGDALRIIERERKRLEKKIPRLEQQLEEARDNQKYREYGDLLFSVPNPKQKESKITLTSYETGEPVTIALDVRYDLKTNANLFYKKYHKLKRAQDILAVQLEEARSDLAYFEQLQEQLTLASAADALEIREELVRQRLLREKKTAKRGKKQKPNILHLQTEQADIYVGKNNLQNNCITHEIARRNDTWFHVKDYHGSHVVLKMENPDEYHIRLCASLAAWFSKGRLSSSVPVDYTKVANLKKVPGSKIGFVTMSTYKTIYIDPEPAEIETAIRELKAK